MTPSSQTDLAALAAVHPSLPFSVTIFRALKEKYQQIMPQAQDTDQVLAPMYSIRTLRRAALKSTAFNRCTLLIGELE